MALWARIWRSVGPLVAVVVLLCSPALAQQRPWGFSPKFELSTSVLLDRVDGAARTHLVNIQAHLRDEQWDEAIERLREIMDSHGDRTIEPAAQTLNAKARDKAAHRTFRFHVSLREYCHRQIASLPAEALKLYRDRVDQQAQRWYEQGLASRDPVPLNKIIVQLYCSRWGDDALLALGEIALEQGHYDAARAAWEQIIPARHWVKIHAALESQPDAPFYLAERIRWHQSPPGSEIYGVPPGVHWLRYPDTDLDLASVLARMALASIHQKLPRRARAEISVLEALHPSAKGTIGGRTVVYAEWLTEQLAASRSWPARRGPTDWTTIAGSSDRSSMIDSKIGLHGRPLVIPLKAQIKASQFARYAGRPHRRVAEDNTGLLSYHPLLVGDLLLIGAHDKIYAYDVRTGKPAFGVGPDKDDPAAFYVSEDRVLYRDTSDALGAPRFTMTVHGDLLFARMGAPQTSFLNGGRLGRQKSSIVTLSLHGQGRKIMSPLIAEGKWSFEGAPLSDGNDLYIGMRRSEVSPQTYVACFTPGPQNTWRLKWRRLIAGAQTPARGQKEEITHNLLTMHEGVLYYNANVGAIAALSASDGRIHWVTLYPRTTRGDLLDPADHLFRDINPCVYHQGMVLVAPADCAGVFALDALTGRMLWAAPHARKSVHLLGVNGDHLVATGRGVQWIDVYGGKVGNDFQHGGYGRGILAGGKTICPTRNELFIFDAQPHSRSAQPIRLDGQRGAGGGNVIMSDRHVVIAAADKIYIFNHGSPVAPPVVDTKPDIESDKPPF